MPLYPYRCTECGYRFEKIQHFHSKPETKCPQCGGKLERPLTAPGLKFVGSGWYVNDYSHTGGVPAGATAQPAKAPAESKAAAPCAGNCKACPAASNAAD